MSSPSSNTEEGEAWLLQVESRGEEFAEIVMEEDEGDSFGIHPPASKRGTLAGISTHPNPHQAMRFLDNQEDPRDLEEFPTRRPLHRLHQNNFHNLIHNYGFENTPRVHIPSNWDISRPRESDAGTNSWGPENKHIMAEVEKNTELLHQALREIHSLREAIRDILDKISTSSPPPSSSPKEN